MVRRPLTVLALIGCLVLSGCSLIPLPLPFLDRPAVDLVEPLEVGTCLGEMNGYDSDRRSVVECTTPHLYDVVGTSEWPEMAATVDDLGARFAFREFTNPDTEAEYVLEYWEWASETCSSAVREAIGWDASDLAGYSADELWILPGGEFGVDLSLANEQDFIAGDHTTVCSVMWWEPIAYESELTIDRLMFDAGFPIEQRDCWIEVSQESLEWTFCDEPHTDQSVLTFEGSTAFGLDFIRPPAALSLEEQSLVGDFCWQLVIRLVPDFDEAAMYTWAWPVDSPAWDALADGPADPEERYFFQCGVAMVDGSTFTGDILSGPITIADSAPAGGSSA